MPTPDPTIGTVGATGDRGVPPLCVRKDTGADLAGADGKYAPPQLDSSGNLRVNIAAGSASGTEYADGAVRGTATGTISMVDDGTNIQSMKGDASGRPAINIEQVSGSTLALGQALAASSVPVVLTAAQISTLTPPAQGLTDGQLRATAVPVSGTVTANLGTIAGVATETTLASALTALQLIDNAISGAGFNITQQGGVAVSLNTGVRDAGTQRVTIATNDVVPVTDNAGSLTVDAPVGTPAFVRLSDGAAAITTLPISAASLPLPSGASTEAKQPSLGTAGSASANVITIQGIAGMTKLLVTPDSVALPANQSVNVAQLAGTSPVTAGVAGTQAVGGNVATNVAIGTNPINLGGQAISAENTAITATRMAQLVTDLVGKLIVLPYANPENFVSGATASMTGTTSTSLIAAPAAGLRNYITTIIVSNAHASVGTNILIQDGSGGTTLLVIPAASVFGGMTITLPTPLRQPTAATALFCVNVTTGSSTRVSAVGYIGR